MLYRATITWLLAGSVAILLVATLPSGVRGAAPPASSGIVNGSIDYLPAVTLVDQTGHAVTLASLKGKPVLVSFIHTSCLGPCELMTAKMHAIAEHLGSEFGNRVTMLAVTTDPEHDRPRQMLAYANKQNATGPGWLFLSGSPKNVKKILALYGIPHGDNDADEMTHVFDLYLIGSDGRMMRHYHGNDIASDKVADDIAKADTVR